MSIFEKYIEKKIMFTNFYVCVFLFLEKMAKEFKCDLMKPKIAQFFKIKN